MKIGFNPGSIVNVDGTPLVGRILVYYHDTDTKVDIFTMNGSNFVQSENPVLLDAAGRIPDTIFFDAQIVDVQIQTYVGEPGQMSDDSPDCDFEDFDRFEAGFSIDASVSNRTVNTIEELKELPDPTGIVLVNYYRTQGDCFPRYYVWNPGCQRYPDAGCVIGSNVDSDGRWCYLCESEAIHSSVYGFNPSNVSNAGSFFDAPLSLTGQYTIVYPTTLYFDSGTYTALTGAHIVQSGRRAVFSSKCKFPSASISADEIDVDGRNTDYIADLYTMSSANHTEVHSSWFRTLQAFFHCNAVEKIIDTTNYFESTLINGDCKPSGIIKRGFGDDYSAPILTMSFTPYSYIDFQNVTFIGNKIFGSDLKAKFTNCNFNDDLFVGVSAIDFGDIASHNIDVDSWKITDAVDANMWLLWAKAKGMTTIVLCGRAVGDILYNSFLFITGGRIEGTIATNVNLSLTNIVGNVTVYPILAGKTLTAVRCQSVRIFNTSQKFASITVADSSITSVYELDTSVIAYAQRGGSFSGQIVCDGWNRSSGAPTSAKQVSFENCVLQLDDNSYFNKLVMRNCENIGYGINVIPYKDTDANKFFIEVDLLNSRIPKVAFTDSSVGNPDVYESDIKTLNIVDCRIDRITMPYWSNAVNCTYLMGGNTPVVKGNFGTHFPKTGVDEIQNESLFTDFGNRSQYLATSTRIINFNVLDEFEFGEGIAIRNDGTSKVVQPYLAHAADLDNDNDQFLVRIGIYGGDHDITAEMKVFNPSCG